MLAKKSLLPSIYPHFYLNSVNSQVYLDARQLCTKGTRFTWIKQPQISHNSYRIRLSTRCLTNILFKMGHTPASPHILVRAVYTWRQSQICQLGGGQTKSQRGCKECSSSTTSYQRFVGLHFSISFILGR